LEEATREYFETDWYSCGFGRTPEVQYSLKVVVRGSPRDFGLIVSDAVHNLRAALDLLAVEVVAQNQKKESECNFSGAGVKVKQE